MDIEEVWRDKGRERFHCQYCGRFAKFITFYFCSNTGYTDLVFEWKCSHCGYVKEGQW